MYGLGLTQIRIKELSEKIDELDIRLKHLEQVVLQSQGPTASDVAKPSFDMAQLFDLPDSLRKTLRAMQSLVEADAQTVAPKTERSRTVENIYLNQLTRLGYLTKARKGRKTFFKLAKYY